MAGNDLQSKEEISKEYLDNVMNVKLKVENNRLNDCNPDEEIGYVSAPIDALGPPGRWIRHMLLESILYGTPVLVAIQHLRNKHTTRFMKLASVLGTEDFYAVLLCVMLWIIDMKFGRLLSVAMAVGFYLANALKNSLCLPRPPTPPVIPIENAFYTWGLPSHHSVLAVVCPWYIWFYCLLHYHIEFPKLVILFIGIALWSSSVLICRIYNGVHSPADVIAGSLLGVLIVTFMNRYGNLLDLSDMFTGQGALLVPIYAGILLILHPYDEIGVAAFSESTSMVSSTVGVILARSFSYGRTPALKSVMEMYQHSEASLWYAVYVGMARILIGAVIVVSTKVILKIIGMAIMSGLMKLIDLKYYTKTKTSVYYTGYSKDYCLPPIYKNKKKDHSEEENECENETILQNITQMTQSSGPWNISHIVRFFTYIGMGFSAYYVTPAFCHYIGLVL